MAAGTDKTVIATIELRVTLPEEAADLMKNVMEERGETSLTKNISIWDYSPEDRLISVEVE